MTFHDPMVDPMPYAPSLKMFCVYGVNKPVERCVLRDCAPGALSSGGVECQKRDTVGLRCAPSQQTLQSMLDAMPLQTL